MPMPAPSSRRPAARRSSALVYVAALAPDEGETVADVFYRAEPHPQAPKLAPDSHGLIWLPEGAFAAAFAQHASAEEQALLAAVQRPIAVPCISVKVERPLWKDRPSWFLVAEEDRMIVPETQRFMAERMKARVRRHPVDHTPIVTAPGVVVDMILDARASVVPARNARQGHYRRACSYSLISNAVRNRYRHRQGETP